MWFLWNVFLKFLTARYINIMSSNLFYYASQFDVWKYQSLPVIQIHMVGYIICVTKMNWTNNLLKQSICKMKGYTWASKSLEAKQQ